jgi:hypothetical protein
MECEDFVSNRYSLEFASFVITDNYHEISNLESLLALFFHSGVALINTSSWIYRNSWRLRSKKILVILLGLLAANLFTISTKLIPVGTTKIGEKVPKNKSFFALPL